jgi:hypothetical protein
LRKFVLVFFLLLLNGCSTQLSHTNSEGEKVNKSTVVSKENKKNDSENNVEVVENQGYFNVPFIVNGSLGAKIEMTISQCFVLQNQSMSEEDNSSYNYIRFNLDVKNIGEVNTNNTIHSSMNFMVWDENEELIEEGLLETLPEETYQSTHLDPGEENRGVMYLAIPKNAVASKLVYSNGLLGKEKYVFDLEQY